MASESISKELKDQNPHCCGLSAESVRRFRHDHQSDKKPLLEKEKLGSTVKEEVLQVKVCNITFIKW